MTVGGAPKGAPLHPLLFRASAFHFQLRAGACLCCRQPRREHAEGRTRYVVEAEVGTELDRGRLAAVFAADPDLDGRTSRPALLDRNLDELSDAFAIKHGERVLLQDAFGKIRRQELVDVVA